MSTRDCAGCGREAGFHTVACPRPDTGISTIRAQLTQLYGAALTWASDARSRWAPQLVDDLSRALGTVKWIEGDIERKRVDEALRVEEEKP